MELPYLAYFHLKEEPFSTVPSPRYFFLTSAHGTALEKTAYVVGAKKGLAAVFGDTGTGKSSLARLLHQKFLDGGILSTLITNPNYPTPNSFLRTIAQEFGTPGTDRSFKGMLDLFKRYLFTHAVDERQTVVLILDEAQTLRPALIELLRQLVNRMSFRKFGAHDALSVKPGKLSSRSLRRRSARPYRWLAVASFRPRT
jgi:general secretion pathway protein A